MSAGSSRFIVATHILAVLAYKPEETVNSERVASSLNTSPVLVRRLVGALLNAGLVESYEGPRGGARLARAADSISLQEIYRAVEPKGIGITAPNRAPNLECPIGKCVQAVVGRHVEALEARLDEELGQTTLEQVLEETLKA